MDKQLRALLIGPVRGLDPDNGDLTYTEQLRDAPPPGVTYVPYDTALEEGSLVELYRRAGAWHGPRSAGDAARFGREAAVNRVRSTGLLFREPFRHFKADPAAFDLVHVHVFSVALECGDLPIVVGNSVPIHSVYEDGRCVHRTRVRAQRTVDRWLAKRTGVMHNSYGLHRADMVVSWSDLLRDWYLRYLRDPGQVEVVPPGLALTRFAPAVMRSGPVRLGFIGDWAAKGGDVVLAAYRRLRARRGDVELTIVGSRPPISGSAMSELGITWLPRQPRDRLLADVIPTFGIFVYPSRFDGVPLTLLEVMASGVPAIVSDYGALPEVVDHGRAGLVSRTDDPASLENAITMAMALEARVRLGRAARDRVAQRFELGAVNRKLRLVYENAFARAAARRRG